MKSEAERACAKEAAASRHALEALQKELAVQPQVNSFVIEDSCTETTVENFIPHSDGRFVENVRDFQGLPVVNYYSVNGTGYANRGQSTTNLEKTLASNSLLQFNIRNDGNTQTEMVTTDKVKSVLDGDITHNVEIMFKTSEGDFVSVTDELLQNISKSALQYQVIDENGFAGEMQELRVLNKVILDPSAEVSHKFIYDQNGINPSIIDATLNELPSAEINKETTEEIEEANKEKNFETEMTTDSSSDALIKDLQIQETKSEVESCLNMLLPQQSFDTITTNPDTDKATFTSDATTDSFIAGFSLTGALDQCDENTNVLDYHKVLEGIEKEQSDSEMCSAEKKQKLMSEESIETETLEILNQSEDSVPVTLQFSPRRTRSTIKLQNRTSLPSEDANDMESIKEDKMRTRKTK